MARKIVPAKNIPPHSKAGGAVSRALRPAPLLFISAAVKTGEIMMINTKINLVFS